MKVFISWSGEQSQRYGKILSEWIPSVLQFAKPYFTPDDIEKGSRWNSEISQILDESKVGIICLTPNNLEKPWIMFEAGALSKTLEKSKVCPLLFGVDNSDVEGPLVQFQTTLFQKEEMKRLMSSINASGDTTRLEQEVFNRVFDKWWPDLENEISEATTALGSGTDSPPVRGERDVIDEILALVRNMSKRTPATQSHLPPGLYRDLVASYVEIHDAITTGKGHEDILKNLKTLSLPVGYLVDRMPRSTDTDDLRQALKSLHYKYLGDDIPF